MKQVKKILITLYILVVFTFAASFTMHLVDNQKLSGGLLPNDIVLDPGQLLAEIAYVSPYVYFSELSSFREEPLSTKTYVIEDEIDLYNFSILLSGPNRKKYLDKHYVLGKDIDYTSQSATGKRFRPIGFLPPTGVDTNATNTNAFGGTFDGRGFKITNLAFEEVTLDKWQDPNIYSESLQQIAMFSNINKKGIVRNFQLVMPMIAQPTSFNGLIKSASYVFGDNYGTVEYISVLDERITTPDNTGIAAIGMFNISLMGIRNYGTFSNSYAASPRIAHKVITDDLSRSPLLHINSGATIKLMFDKQILLDSSYNGNFIGHNTADFKVTANFTAERWFFYNAYSSQGITLTQNYPVLQGLVSGNLANRSEDFIWYMNQVNHPFHDFRKMSIILQADVDMKGFSRTAIPKITTAFEGSLTGNANLASRRLFMRDNPVTNPANKGGLPSTYAAIIGLEINEKQGVPSANGDEYNIGLFPFFSGKLGKLMFPRAELNVDTAGLSQYSSVNIGLLAGSLHFGEISHVWVDVDMEIHSAHTIVNMGGVVGKFLLRPTASYTGKSLPTLQYTTINSRFHGKALAYHGVDSISVGGSVGFIERIYVLVTGVKVSYTGMIESQNNYFEGTGLTFSTTASITTILSLGGMVGKLGGGANFSTGSSYNDLHLAFSYNMISNKIKTHSNYGATGYSFVGGSVGLKTFDDPTRAHPRVGPRWNNNKIQNEIDVVVNGEKTILKVAGDTTAVGTVLSWSYGSPEHAGKIKTVFPSGTNNLTVTQMKQINIQIAGIQINVGGTNMTDSMSNYTSLDVDLSVAPIVSGGYIENNAYDSTKLNIADPAQTTIRNLLDKLHVYRGDSFFVSVSTSSANSNYNYGDINAYTNNVITADVILISGVSVSAFSSNLTFRNSQSYGNINVKIDHAIDGTYAISPLNLLKLSKRSVIVSGFATTAGYSSPATYAYYFGEINVDTTSTKTITMDLFVSTFYMLEGASNTASFSNITVNNYMVGSSYVSGLMIHGQRSGSQALSRLQNFGKVLHNYGQATSATVAQYEGKIVRSAGVGITTYGRVYLPNSKITAVNFINFGEITTNVTVSTVASITGGIIADTFVDMSTGTIVPAKSSTEIHNSINYGKITNNNTIPYNDTVLTKISAAGGILGFGYSNSWWYNVNYGDVSSTSIAGGMVGFYDFGKLLPLASPTILQSATTLHQSINYGKVTAPTAGGIYGVFSMAFTSATASNGSTLLGNTANLVTTSNFVGKSIVTGTPLLANSQKFPEYHSTVKLNDTSPAPFANVRSYSMDDATLTGQTGYDGTQYAGIFNKTNSYFMTTINVVRFLEYDLSNSTLLSSLEFGVGNTTGYFPMTNLSSTAITGKIFPVDVDLTLYVDSAIRDSLLNGKSYRSILTHWIRQDSPSKTVWILAVVIRNKLINESINSSYIIDKTKATITFYYSPSYHDTKLTTLAAKTVVESYIKAAADLTKYGAYEDPANPGKYLGTHIKNASGGFEAQAGGGYVVVPVDIYQPQEDSHSWFGAVGATNTLVNSTGRVERDKNVEATLSNRFARIPKSPGPYNENGEIVDVSGNVIDSIGLQSSRQEMENNSNVGYIDVFSEAHTYDANTPLDPFGDNTFTRYYLIMKRLKTVSVKDMDYHFSTQELYNYTIDSAGDALLELTVDDIITDYSWGSVWNYYYIKASNVVGTFGYDINGLRKNYIFGETTYGPKYDFLNVVKTDDSGVKNLSIQSRELGINDLAQQDFTNDRFGVVTNTANYVFYLMVTVSGAWGKEVDLQINFYDFAILMHYTRTPQTTLTIPRVYDSQDTAGFTYEKIDANDFQRTIPYAVTSAGSGFGKLVNFDNMNNHDGLSYGGSGSLTLANGTSIQISSNGVARANYHVNTVTVSVAKNANTTHTYHIKVSVSSEDRSQTIIVNIYLNETLPVYSKVPQSVVKNGTIVPGSPIDIEFTRTETPTYVITHEIPVYFTTRDVQLSYVGTGTPIAEDNYRLTITANTIAIIFTNRAPVGEYIFKMKDDKKYTFAGTNNSLNGQSLSWQVAWTQMMITKIGSSDPLLKNINFIGEEGFFTDYDTVIDYEHMNTSKYLQYYNNTIDRIISVVPGQGIVYGQYTTKQDFWIVGLVAKTDLTYYLPNFTLPEMGTMVRVDAAGNEHTDLATDYTPKNVGSQPEDFIFNYIHYRVYAENYIPNHPKYGDLFKDYYVAIIDRSDNVTLQFSLEYVGTTNPFTNVFFSLQINHSSLGTLTSRTNFFGYFGEVAGEREKTGHIRHNLPMVTSGVYFIETSLPGGYLMRIYIDDVLKATGGEKVSWSIPNSVLPTLYKWHLVIFPDPTYVPPWGQTNNNL